MPVDAGETMLVTTFPEAPLTAAGPAAPLTVSLDAIFTSIENSNRIYNIEFKIWGVKKKENFIRLFILF